MTLGSREKDGSEWFAAHNYEVVECVPSVFVEGETVERLLGYTCPACGKLMKLDHGDTSYHHPRHAVSLYGNALSIRETSFFERMQMRPGMFRGDA